MDKNNEICGICNDEVTKEHNCPKEEMRSTRGTFRERGLANANFKPPPIMHKSVSSNSLIPSQSPKEKKSPNKENGTRIFIIKELIQTEKTYLDALQNLFDTKEMMISNGIKDNLIDSVFLNVEILHKLHENLSGELEKLYANTEKDPILGEAIGKMTPYMKMYTSYVDRYDETIEIINENFKNNERFSRLVEEIKYAGFNGMNALMSLRITPIQRIPRYVLLLRDLLKNTPQNHQDFQSIKNALEAVSEIATFINERKSVSQSNKRILEINGNLVGNLTLLHDPFINRNFKTKHKWVVCGKSAKCNLCCCEIKNKGYNCSECKFQSHGECIEKCYPNCGQPLNPPSLLVHNRKYVTEIVVIHLTDTNLSNQKSTAILFNDCVAIFQINDKNKYEIIDIVRWLNPASRVHTHFIQQKNVITIKNPLDNYEHILCFKNEEECSKFNVSLKDSFENWLDQYHKLNERKGVNGEEVDKLTKISVSIIEEESNPLYVVTTIRKERKYKTTKNFEEIQDFVNILKQIYENECIPMLPKVVKKKKNLKNESNCKEIEQFFNVLVKLKGIFKLPEVKKFFRVISVVEDVDREFRSLYCKPMLSTSFKTFLKDENEDVYKSLLLWLDVDKTIHFVRSLPKIKKKALQIISTYFDSYSQYSVCSLLEESIITDINKDKENNPPSFCFIFSRARKTLRKHLREYFVKFLNTFKKSDLDEIHCQLVVISSSQKTSEEFSNFCQESDVSNVSEFTLWKLVSKYSPFDALLTSPIKFKKICKEICVLSSGFLSVFLLQKVQLLSNQSYYNYEDILVLDDIRRTSLLNLKSVVINFVNSNTNSITDSRFLI
eukprot:TRINITY_DN13929_c0_g1_i1.p1 TRINITY_DN13929_c0_g1~~TRINITY_DN13929_c0_g1_i1.p1  ORF type:complete len:837 (-),score=174.65 TRINITY_DN13929_c0_g1_i1:38-2548(-)